MSLFTNDSVISFVHDKTVVIVINDEKSATENIVIINGCVLRHLFQNGTCISHKSYDILAEDIFMCLENTFSSVFSQSVISRLDIFFCTYGSFLSIKYKYEILSRFGSHR